MLLLICYYTENDVSTKSDVDVTITFCQKQSFAGYQENCPPENCPPMKAPLAKIIPQNFSPEKIAPWENCPLWNTLPTYKSYKCKKKQITNFFAMKKAVQYSIQRKITNVLFDTQMISQKILGLDTFFTEWIKSKSRRTETRQSNYKIW